MRSPSVTRSAGSKTPRSVVSEPNASGNASFNVKPQNQKNKKNIKIIFSHRMIN